MISSATALAVLRNRWTAVAAALAVLTAARAAVAETKIGYFDVKRILAEAEDAKVAKNRLQKEFDEKQKQLDAAKAEFEKAQKDFQARQAVLSPQAREQAQVELQNKLMNAQKLLVELQTELAQKEQNALGDLLGKLEPVVREIADSEGYTFVFEKTEAGLFYAQGGHDLTAQIIRRYNARNPAGGGKAAPKGDKK